MPTEDMGETRAAWPVDAIIEPVRNSPPLPIVDNSSLPFSREEKQAAQEQDPMLH